MKRMLLISHALHQKTKSIDFLIDLFTKDYNVAYCFIDSDDPRGSDSLIPFLDNAFDLVVCIQVVPPPDALKRLSRRRVVFFPMYDHSGSWGIESWFPLRHLRIISFSSHLTRQLRRWGFNVHGIQYFPRPNEAVQWGDPQKAFFWNRTETIDIEVIATRLAKSSVEAIHVHRIMDPGQVYTPPTDQIEKRFVITESDWFHSRAELMDQIESCGLYMAPRLKEGIGMSFLEAMALGRCVVAPDRPTMNEYIIHGETGLLYDPAVVVPLELADIRGIQERTLACVRRGHARWEDEKGNILSWCEVPAVKTGWRPWLYLVLRIGLHPFGAFKPWRRRAISIRFRRGHWRVSVFGRIVVGAPDRRF